ncbi:uncharacterized protein METZ01_LOCUS353803, partial [marine metagenome]
MTYENIDPAEIEKFEKLARTWWDLDSEFKPLHDINPLRLGYINQRVQLSGKQALDIGCGGGILTESLARNGAFVTGIDMGTAPLQVARLHRHESDLEIDYQQMTAEAMAQQYPGKFDVVTCLEMLEHVPDPGSVISACRRLLKPNGHLFLSTINRNPKAYLFAIIGGEHLLKLLPPGTHDYQKFIKPSELAKTLRELDLALKDITGMTYNPISQQYKLTS